MVKSIAVLGTGSDVGKTTIAAGICRILASNGTRVAPFKAQNMSNNAEPAFITPPIFDGDDGDDGDNESKHSCHDNNHDISISGSLRNFSHPSGKRWGEIGTAQALQAEASLTPPLVEMNPILLKSGGRGPPDPTTGYRPYLCNVVVLGQSLYNEDYGTLKNRTPGLKRLVVGAHRRLARLTQAEVVVIEGAGSCTELNLMDRDVVNLPLVRELECPWILVANIDPGGVFAQIVGTKACVTERDWEACAGVVVNRLRGELKYFEDGVGILEEMVGKKVFVVPFLDGVGLKEEDIVGVERRLAEQDHNRNHVNDYDRRHKHKPTISIHRIVILAYPCIAITSDITPIENDSNFKVEWRRNAVPRQSYPDITAIILPGSRLTCSDLDWLKSTEWLDYLTKFVSLGGMLVGICGGYQMLGLQVSDPDGVEGDVGGVSEGLGYLPIETTIASAQCKIVRPRIGVLFNSRTEDIDVDIPVEGFELHCGHTTVNNNNMRLDCQPLISFTDCADGKQSVDGLKVGNVCGTYMHGILKTRILRRAILLDDVSPDDSNHTDDEETDPLDKLASHLEGCGLNFKVLSDMVSHQF